MTSEAVAIFKNLDSVLEDEIRVYRSLLDLVRKEKEILIAAKINDLNENNMQKEAFIMKIRALEKSRERLARDLAAAVGAPTETPRLLEIASKIESEYSEKLRSIHATLDLLIRRIRDINISNEDLIKASLKFVDGALGAIKDTLKPKPTYASSGDIKNKSAVSGHFVSKDV